MLSIPEKAAQIMEHLCTHDSHGYSQYSRLGDGGKETITLSDGSAVEIATGDRDCSSAVINSYQAAGVNVNATYTGNMRSGFTKTGLFTWYPWGTYTPKRGDIYLNESHHTAMCLGNNKLGEFSISETGGVDGAEGDQTGWESHIRNFYTYSHGWDGVLAYTGPIETESDEEDDMTECVINIPQADDMAANFMVYICGDHVHDIPDPEALKYLNAVYKAVHGKDIPTFEMSGSRSIPEFQRYLSVLRGGVPDPSIYPAVDQFAGRSANRACGNKGTE